MNALDKFRIDGKVAIITGGGGLLGGKHAEAIMEGLMNIKVQYCI